MNWVTWLQIALAAVALIALFVVWREISNRAPW